MNKLGGSLFCYRAIVNDYCLKESIESLVALCDEVVLLDCGSDDGSVEILKSFESEKVKVVCLPASEWEVMKGKEKLAHFTNIAKSMLSTEWHFNLQADEIVDERSFESIREAIEKDEEGFLCTRINLWGNSQHKLNVGDDRLPCGNKIVRLARTKYFSFGDGEGLFSGSTNWDYLHKIKIWHMGFVRDKHIHPQKIEYMLTKVFGMGMDQKVVAMNGVFDPFINFSKDDLAPIGEPLPVFVQAWAKERDEINQIII